MNPGTSDELAQVMSAALIGGQRQQVSIGISRRAWLMSRMDRRSRRIFAGLQWLYPTDRVAALGLRSRGWKTRQALALNPLFTQVLKESSDKLERPLRIFHFGERPGVGKRILAQLEAAHPGVKSAGSRAVLDELWGPENHQALHLICDAKPDILLVALPSPLLEEWIHAHTSVLDVGLVWGIGRQARL